MADNFPLRFLLATFGGWVNRVVSTRLGCESRRLLGRSAVGWIRAPTPMDTAGWVGL